MSDVALPNAPVVGPRRVLRTVFEWFLLGLLTVLLGSLLVLAMLASGCSLEFALGVLLGNMKRGLNSSCGERENERALRLGRALRQRLGLDALTRYRAAKRQAAIEQRRRPRAA